MDTELDISIKSYRGDEMLKVNEAMIKRERDKIEHAFFHDRKGRGKIILRKDKEQFTNEKDRLVKIITEYRKEMKTMFVNSKKEFREQLVREFLELWQDSPPDRLKRRGQIAEQFLREDIENGADSMFEKAVALGTTEAKVVYKDISIEYLKDGKLMDGLRRLMENAGVDQATVRRLFQSGDTVAARDAFPKV